MNIRVARSLLVVLSFTACPEITQPDAGPFDAGVFVAKCAVTPVASITCTDGGPCPLIYGSELDCGVDPGAVAATAAGADGRGHALFAVSDRENLWHTQRVAFSAAEPRPTAELDVLPLVKSTVALPLALAANGSEPPLAFFKPEESGVVQATFPSGPIEIAWSTPDGGGFAGLLDVAMASGGRGYALVSATGAYQLTARGDGGTWSATSIAGTEGFPSAALALDRAGGAHLAWWKWTSDTVPAELHLRSASGTDTTVLTEGQRRAPVFMRLAIGVDDAGVEVPVMAYAHEGSHVVVPADDGGVRKLRMAEPGVTNTCPTGVLHATCADCPNPTCSRKGDAIQDYAMATTDDGTVFLAVLMQKVDVDANVKATPTTFGGVVINCDCDVTVTRDGSRTTGVIIYRVVPGSGGRLEKRTTVDVPRRARQLGFEQVGGKFHLSFLDGSETTRQPVLRYLVLDVAPLL